MQDYFHTECEGNNRKITKSIQITIQWYGLASPVSVLVNHRTTQQYPELSISSYVTVILYQWLDNLLT